MIQAVVDIPPAAMNDSIDTNPVTLLVTAWLSFAFLINNSQVVSANLQIVSVMLVET